MMKSGKFAVLAMLGALAVSPAYADNKAAILVNGVAIPQSRIDYMAASIIAQGQPDGPELRKELRDIVINQELMAQEAVKLGLDKQPDLVTAVELAKQAVLIGAFQQHHATSQPIGEDQLKQEYDKLKARLGDKEYKARHIQVSTEEEAKAIIAQLGKKAKFEKLAEKSLDVESAKRGGELGGWAIPTRDFPPPFASALLSLQKGEYTKVPVELNANWHVIKLDDVRELKVPSFDELKPQLQQRLMQQSIKKAIDDLRAKSRIE